MLDQVQKIFDQIEFDYSACSVKGRPSLTWKARLPAILLSLARLGPKFLESRKTAEETFSFYSSKEIIQFFNDEWAHLVRIPSGKQKISLGNYDDFRDHGVIPLVENGFAIRNTSIISKNINGKDTAYSVTPEALKLILSSKIKENGDEIAAFLVSRTKLISAISPERIRVNPLSDNDFRLNKDNHNLLQKHIIEEMLPRFSPESRLIYTADTEERSTFFNFELADKLGISQVFSEKKPDIVAYDPKRDWIFIIEAVTSTGHINESRRRYFLHALGERAKSAVFVTAYPNREIFRRFAADMAWETEVWLASEPDHMIHFNGDRFLGPHPTD